MHQDRRSVRRQVLCYEFGVILQSSLWMHSHTQEMKTDENYLTWTLFHSSWKERDGGLKQSQARRSAFCAFCAFPFSLFKQLSVIVPWLQRTNFRDLSAAHADESAMVCFVTELIAFLISHVSLSYQKSNYKIQSPAFPAIQGSSALQFVLMSSVLWIHPCNFILAESLSHYPFLGTVINMYLPLEMIRVYFSQKS